MKDTIFDLIRLILLHYYISQGMVGGKGERKSRKDPNASAFDGAEGGRNAISPQKAERDRAKEVRFGFGKNLEISQFFPKMFF